MRVIIKPDYPAVSSWAADYIADKIKTFAPAAGQTFCSGTADRLNSAGNLCGTDKKTPARRNFVCRRNHL